MELLEEFREYLKTKQVSKNTCKNYVSDLSTFVDFLKTKDQYFSVLTLPFILDSNTLSTYKNWLEKTVPTTTANRRLSAIRKFINFAVESNSISRDYVGSVSNIVNILPTKGEQTLDTVNKFLDTHVSDSKVVNDYTSDLNTYLISNTPSRLQSVPLEQRPFSPKKFWQWKNQTSATVTVQPPLSDIPSITISKSDNKTAIVLTFGVVTILLSLLALVAVVSLNRPLDTNNHPRGFGDLKILPLISKIQTTSLTTANQIVNSLPSGTSGLVDPTESTKSSHLNFLAKRLERSWSIFWEWLTMPRLIDPTG